MTKSRPDIAALKDAEVLAHKAPWKVEVVDLDSTFGLLMYIRPIQDGDSERSSGLLLQTDADFIVALRNAFPAPCETLERYEAALTTIQDAPWDRARYATSVQELQGIARCALAGET